MERPIDNQSARDILQGCLQSLILPAGIMAGLDTVRDCMKDETIRPFLGHALLHEIMPSMGLNKETLDPLVIEICNEMENPTVIQPLSLLLNNAIRAWAAQTLPLLKAYLDREDELPPCLCMSLAMLIMLFAGTRREQDGDYAILKNGEPCRFTEDEDVLFSFSRLSCDMPAESLAYAVLSDRAIWEENLRELPGLEDKIASDLRDLQLLGLEEAINKTWKK
ncbi:MAG: hypothetical protein Q4G00_14605 [Clostridia bacterium]|nr:hypothetical protein [Clostridia bacterium]